VLRRPNDCEDSLYPSGQRVQIHASTSNLATRNPGSESTFAPPRKQPGDFLPTPVRGRTDFKSTYPLSSEDIAGWPSGNGYPKETVDRQNMFRFRIWFAAIADLCLLYHVCIQSPHLRGEIAR
jgi:hypothetical protein